MHTHRKKTHKDKNFHILQERWTDDNLQPLQCKNLVVHSNTLLFEQNIDNCPKTEPTESLYLK